MKILRIALSAVLLVICFFLAACSYGGANIVAPADLTEPADYLHNPEPEKEPQKPAEEPREPATYVPAPPAEPTAPPVVEQIETPKSPDTPVIEPYEPPVPAVLPIQTTETLLCSVTNGLNVRSGAGTNYKVIGTLDKDDMVMPLNKIGDWCKILYLGGHGYVALKYVKEVTFNTGDEKTERVITEGKRLLGIPYVYGAARYHFGNGVLNANFDGKSYDCSSYVQYIFKKGAGVNLASTSREQSRQGKEVKREDIKRGDLLFFTNASRKNKSGIERIGHVALYLGNNIIMHTASDHAVIEPISQTRSGYFVCAKRIL